MARRKRHTPEQVVRKLTQADRMRAEGQEVPDVCRELQVSEQTYYRLRNQFGGLKANDTKRLKDLERENATPKRLLADAELEKAALQEIARETFKPAAQAGSRASPHRGDECQRAVRLSGHRTAPHHPASPATQPNADRPRRGAAGMAATVGSRPSALGFPPRLPRRPRGGWYVNHKRLQRLWREEGLRVPQRRRRNASTPAPPPPPRSPTLPTGCGRWTYAWRRAASLVTYFPRAAFRCAEDTALRCVRSDATEAKV